MLKKGGITSMQKAILLSCDMKTIKQRRPLYAPTMCVSIIKLFMHLKYFNISLKKIPVIDFGVIVEGAWNLHEYKYRLLL